MSGDERFPKPDVPWFHEVYGRVGWSGTDDERLSVNGYWRSVRVDGLPCGFTAPTPTGDWCRRNGTTCCKGADTIVCCLPVGHDGPHLAGCPHGPGCFSLRRIAQPAEVAS